MSHVARRRAKTCRIGFRLSRKQLKIARLLRYTCVQTGRSEETSRMLPAKEFLPKSAKALSSRRDDSLKRQQITSTFSSENHFLATAFVPFRAPFFALSKRSMTAATMIGRPTAPSPKTSPNFPPSNAGTTFPHEITSLYEL